MAIEWNELITIADELATAKAHADVSEEAYKRSSVNRAYYGAIHLAENVLLNEGSPQPDRNRWHAFIISSFMNSDDKYRIGIGNHLDKLRQYRRKAGYEPDFEKMDWNCTASLRLAKDLEGWLAAL